MKLTKEQVILTLKLLKKNQETMTKKMDTIISKQNTMQDTLDMAAAPVEKSWAKQFVEDPEIAALNSVTGIGSTF